AVAGGERSLGVAGARQDVAVQLDGDRPRIAAHCREEIGHRRPRRDLPRLAVDDDRDAARNHDGLTLTEAAYSRCLSSARPIADTAVMMRAAVPRTAAGISKERRIAP